MKKSFTLIELLLTLLIVVMLTAASLPVIRKFQRSADVKVVANEIKSAVLQAQNYSLAPRVGTAGINSYSVVFNVADNQYCIIENYDPTSTPKTCLNDAVSGTFRTLPQNAQFVADASSTPPSFQWDKNYLSPPPPATTAPAIITFLVTNQGRIAQTNWVAGESAAVIKVVNNIDHNEAWNVSVNKVTGAVTMRVQ